MAQQLRGLLLIEDQGFNPGIYIEWPTTTCNPALEDLTPSSGLRGYMGTCVYYTDNTCTQIKNSKIGARHDLISLSCH